MCRITVVRGYKYRMYPNVAQRVALAQTFGCCRYVYNWALDRKCTVYAETGKSLSVYDLSKELTILKKEEGHLWLNDVLRVPLKESLRHLGTAFDRFFKKQGGYPKFKSKHNWSYPASDAVAELVERESAVGKTAVCGLNSGSISPMSRCIETEFGIQQQHRFGGEFRACVSSL